MFEGTIHYLGEILFADWNDESVGHKPRSREPIDEKHKIIRARLGLDNGAIEYAKIRSVVKGLIDFRDSFAHPKVIEQAFHFSGPPPNPLGVSVGWEREVELGRVKQDFEDVETYCVGLLDRTASMLQSDFDNGGWRVVREKYAHLKDFRLTIAQIPGLLHNTASGAF